MVTPELTQYVEKSLSSGMSPEKIRGTLLETGWSSTDVDQVLEPAPENKETIKPKFDQAWSVIIYLCGSALVVGGILFLLALIIIALWGGPTIQEAIGLLIVCVMVGIGVYLIHSHAALSKIKILPGVTTRSNLTFSDRAHPLPLSTHTWLKQLAFMLGVTFITFYIIPIFSFLNVLLLEPLHRLNLSNPLFISTILGIQSLECLLIGWLALRYWEKKVYSDQKQSLWSNLILVLLCISPAILAIPSDVSNSDTQQPITYKTMIFNTGNIPTSTQVSENSILVKYFI